MPGRTVHRGFAAVSAGRHQRGPDTVLDMLDSERDLKGEDKVGLTMPFILDRLYGKYESSVLLVDLITYIPFVILFIVFFMLSRGQGTFDMTKTAIDQLLLNDYVDDCVVLKFRDITMEANWISWFEDILIHMLWADSEEPVKGTKLWGGQNQLLGSLRIRTLRTKEHSCTLNSDLFDGNQRDPKAFPCYGSYSTANADHSSLLGVEYRQCEDVGGGTRTNGFVDKYPCGGYVWDIPFSLSYLEAKAAITNFVKAPFLDPKTRFIIVELFTYNAEFDNFLSVKFWVEVTAGGSWWPDAQFQAFKLWTTKNWTWNVVALILLVFLAFFIWRYLYEIKKAIEISVIRGQSMKDRTKAWITFKHVFSVWNILEIVNLTVFVVVLILWFIWWANSKRLPQSMQSFPFPPKYPAELESIRLLFQWQAYLNALNVVLCFLKFLKYVKYVSHFNVVSKTLALVSGEIYGILVLLTALVTCYAIAGVTLFGTQLREFRHFGQAFSSLARALIGDFNYQALWEVNRHVAPLYFWSFVVIGLFLILNFVIAVVSDGFARATHKVIKLSLMYQIERLMNSLKTLEGNDKRTTCLGAFRRLQRPRYNLYIKIMRAISEHNNNRPEMLSYLKDRQRRYQEKGFANLSFYNTSSKVDGDSISEVGTTYTGTEDDWNHHLKKFSSNKSNAFNPCSDQNIVAGLLNWLAQATPQQITFTNFKERVKQLEISLIQPWHIRDVKYALPKMYFTQFVDLVDELGLTLPTAKEQQLTNLDVIYMWNDMVRDHEVHNQSSNAEEQRLEAAVTNGVRCFVQNFQDHRLQRLEEGMIANAQGLRKKFKGWEDTQAQFQTALQQDLQDQLQTQIETQMKKGITRIMEEVHKATNQAMRQATESFLAESMKALPLRKETTTLTTQTSHTHLFPVNNPLYPPTHVCTEQQPAPRGAQVMASTPWVGATLPLPPLMLTHSPLSPTPTTSMNSIATPPALTTTTADDQAPTKLSFHSSQQGPPGDGDGGGGGGGHTEQHYTDTNHIAEAESILDALTKMIDDEQVTQSVATEESLNLSQEIPGTPVQTLPPHMRAQLSNEQHATSTLTTQTQSTLATTITANTNNLTR